MKTIISPAKNMITDKNIIKPINTLDLDENTIILHNKLKNLSPSDFSAYMNVNSEIALKTFAYYQDMNFEGMGTPAIFSYNGIQYKNMELNDFDSNDILFASEHIFIISALYGIINATEPIQPYRLEMGGKIPENLYKFWDNKIYTKLFYDTDTVINLASDEYSKSVTPFISEGNNFITVKFMKYSKGKYKTFATDAKISRGKMVRYIVKNKIDNVEEIKNFCENDYTFSENFSNKNTLVFVK